MFEMELRKLTEEEKAKEEAVALANELLNKYAEASTRPENPRKIVIIGDKQDNCLILVKAKPDEIQDIYHFLKYKLYENL